MIYLKEELQNYLPINLKAIVEDDSEIPDNIKNSIALYNKAIESLRMDSEDIAIIELKKAIAINPNFYEAMNLLGLCYSYVNEYAKAAEMFNEVIAAENNSVKALGYLSKLKKSDDSITGAGKSRKKARSRKLNKGYRDATKVQESVAGKKSSKSNIHKYIIGFIIGGIVVFAISLAAFSDREPTVDIEAMKKQYNEKINLSESKYNDLQKDYNSLQNELEAVNGELEYNNSVIRLYEIESMFSNNKYEEAADMLLLMKTVDFRSEEKKMFSSLYNKVAPAAAESLYEKGKALYKQGRYEEALKNFEKIETYTKNYKGMDAVLYYRGKSYQALEDFIKAKAMYDRIIKEYPVGNEFVYWSKIRLNELPHE